MLGDFGNRSSRANRRSLLWLVGALTAGLTLLGAATSFAASYSEEAQAPRPAGFLSPNPVSPMRPGAFPVAGPTCVPGTWAARTMYPIAVAGAAIVVHGGIIYSFGGFTLASLTASSYKYDPNINAWDTIAPLPSPRAVASAVSDGTYIYVLGGSDSAFDPTNTLWRYDPIANTYSTLQPFTTATTSQAAVYLDGRIYRIGGCINIGCDLTTNVERYSVSGGSWDAGIPYPIPIASLSATVHGGQIYAAGGLTVNAAATAKTYRFDGTTWDDAAIADLPDARYLAADSMYNGRWVIAGGTDDAQFKAFSSVYAWAPGANTWTGLPNMPLPRYFVGGAAAGGAFYAIGGTNTPGSRNPHNQRYAEPPCNTSTPTPIPPTNTPTATGTTAPPSPTNTSSPPSPTNTTEPSPTSTGTPTGTPTSQATASLTGTSTPIPTGTSTGTPSPCPISFTDVQPTDYFYEPVRYLYCRGVISGYGDNTFRPFNNTTRGQLAKIVVAAEGWPIDTTGGPHFNDVAPDNPFYGFIETAFNRQIISGYACGGEGEPCPGLYFRWGNNVTRAQLCKIVVLAEGWPIDTTGGPHFSDVPETDPFYDVIETAFNRGIISGYADGTFRPGSNATRGQIAKIVYQAVTQP